MSFWCPINRPLGRKPKPAELRSDETVTCKLTSGEKRTLKQQAKRMQVGSSTLVARIIRDYLARPRPLTEGDVTLDAAVQQLLFSGVPAYCLPQIVVNDAAAACDARQFAKAKQFVDGVLPYTIPADHLEAASAAFRADELTAMRDVLGQIAGKMRERLLGIVSTDSGPTKDPV